MCQAYIHVLIPALHAWAGTTPALPLFYQMNYNEMYVVVSTK